MIAEFLGSYFDSLAHFWTQALTIRIPHFVILIVIAWWLVGKSRRRRGWGRMCCGCGSRCRCTCGQCCCGADEPKGEDDAGD